MADANVRIWTGGAYWNFKARSHPLFGDAWLTRYATWPVVQLLEQKLSGTGREAGPHEVERPLLLDLRCQLLLAHLAVPGLAVGPEELLLLV